MKKHTKYYVTSDIRRDDFFEKFFFESLQNETFEIKNLFLHKIDDRNFWDRIPNEVKKRYIALGESFLQYEWTYISVMEYVDFFNSESDCARPACELIARQKIAAITHLMIAECIENKGRFLRNITDGIFSVCEQSTWAVSAHFYSCGKNFKTTFDGVAKIPDCEDEIVDLYCARAACALALVSATLQKRLDAISPMIYKRVCYEINKRFFKPYLERDDFWWYTLNTNLEEWPVNNWNTHMNTCLIFCALAVCKDKYKVKKLLQKAIKSLDAYVNLCLDDGACDEGSSYWKASFSQVFNSIAMLEHMTGVKGFFDIPKIRDMAEYILHMRIYDSAYVCYSDARNEQRNLEFAVTVYYLGNFFEDDRYFADGHALYKACGETIGSTVSPLIEVICEMKKLMVAGKIETKRESPFVCRSKWYPDTELLISREYSAYGKGIFLAAKGGHNNENHNHNDVGAYSVYMDKKPCIIDLGVCTYTRELFREGRYGIFSVRSKNHNVPLLSGFEQCVGEMYSVSDVSCVLSDPKDVLSFEIAGAYPKEAGIKSLKREICLHRDESIVTLKDSYSFYENGVYENVFMIPQSVSVSEGCVHAENFVLSCDNPSVVFEAERIQFADAELIAQWGAFVTRVTAQISGKEGTAIFTVTKKGM